MMKSGNTELTIPEELEGLSHTSRRHFLQLAGGITGAGLLFASCTKKATTAPVGNGGVSFGTGDTGVLNYVYALKQLEVAFYTRVIDGQYSGITTDEKALLTDIRDHEVAHRLFFKAFLGGSILQDLDFNFLSIDFTSRTSVLSAAKLFEDLGVSAYNGAGRLFTSPDYLTLAGKIVSVEARHAAYIRDLLGYNSFADITAVGNNGLDLVNTPTTILAALRPYVNNQLDASSLPNL